MVKSIGILTAVLSFVLPPLLTLWLRPVWFAYLFSVFTQYALEVASALLPRILNPDFDGDYFGAGLTIVLGLPFAFMYCALFLILRLYYRNRKKVAEKTANKSIDSDLV